VCELLRCRSAIFPASMLLNCSADKHYTTSATATLCTHSCDICVTWPWMCWSCMCVITLSILKSDCNVAATAATCCMCDMAFNVSRLVKCRMRDVALNILKSDSTTVMQHTTTCCMHVTWPLACWRLSLQHWYNLLRVWQCPQHSEVSDCNIDATYCNLLYVWQHL